MFINNECLINCMSLNNILEKTEEYLKIPSVVRFESPFLARLAEEFSLPGYEINLGGKLLEVRKKGASISPKIITSHIDRHGIVLNQDGRFEFAAFNAKNHYREENKATDNIINKSGSRFIDEEVYAYDISGKKLSQGKVKSFSRSHNTKDIFFEIEGIGKLPPNTPLAYVSQLSLEDSNISSQIDNVISAAVAYQLVKDGFDGTVLFTAEEEIGRSWRHIADYLASKNIESKELLTLDTTPYDDSRAIDGGIIVLRNKDSNGIFNPSLVKNLKEICEKEGIMYEMKDEFIKSHNAKLAEGVPPKKLGKTELGRIVQYTEGRYNGATVQLPTTKYHSNHETTSLKSLENYYNALKILVR